MSTVRNTGIRVENYHQGVVFTPVVREWKAGPEAKFTIGFEVEKEDISTTNKWFTDEVRLQGWVREHDGSLCRRTGFEAVSPTYDLFDDQLDAALTDPCIADHVNAAYNTDTCGGHINYGIVGKDGPATYKAVEGFVPVLLSLYKSRLTKTYSKMKESYDRSKYSAVCIKENYVEFRAPSAVTSVENLIWRRDLLRIASEHLDKGTLWWIRAALTPSHKLHKHLTKVYDLHTLTRRMAYACAIAERMTKKEIQKYVTFEDVAAAVPVCRQDVDFIIDRM